MWKWNLWNVAYGVCGMWRVACGMWNVEVEYGMRNVESETWDVEYGMWDVESGLGNRVFPYISAMVNNGSLTYDHDRDGRPTELGGCTAMVRNLAHDTFLVIRYVKRRLTVLMDIDGKHEWRECLDVPGVRLPRGYYFGTSSVTGTCPERLLLSGSGVPRNSGPPGRVVSLLSPDNHDIISLKLYQLTVERTPEEEKRDREVFLPVVDNLKLPGMEAPLEPMMRPGPVPHRLLLAGGRRLRPSSSASSSTNKWQEQSRKHFY
ncbi:hypothetical protein DUI87_32676 [Hirundo rustica rustica]|uniref:L-type lectin-like domain-containing protein n=1 Tax=Hirundo rustica rustica TaxID=333673 RepID=A0A3M0IRQ4_HIRRU|nr:hypothetical protein DUI87_32676 [Hirundo rustica rustica]